MKHIAQLSIAALAYTGFALPLPAQEADKNANQPNEAPKAAKADDSATASDNATPTPTPAPTPSISAQQRFANLPAEQRQEFGNLLMKAQALFNQKRVLDAMQVVDDLDKIFVGHPAALNLRGACYVEIRAFNKAYPLFEKILEINPGNINVAFNLAEIDFVTRKWESAHQRFSLVISKLPAKNKAMRRLCEFKLLLCKLKMNRIEEAHAMRDKYDSWDDSPFYYYSRAAILFHQGDKEAAEKLLLDARFIWASDAALSSWQDTMIEFGYVRSFYGGDTDEEATQDAELIKPGNAPLIRLDNP